MKLLPACFLTDILIVKSGIGISMGRLGIFAILGLVTSFSLLNTKLSDLQKRILLLYFISIIYLCVIWAFSTPGHLEDNGPRMIIKHLIMGAMLMIVMNESRMDIIALSKFLTNVAFILAALSIIQYFGYLYGFISLTAQSLPMYAGSKLLGMGGFIDPSRTEYMYGIPYRNIGFFSEPTNFAQFLQIPLFLALLRYMRERRVKNLFVVLVIAAAFGLTFSVANFFGLLVVLIIYYSMRDKSKRVTGLGVVARFAGLIAACYALYVLYDITNKYDYNSEVIIGKNTFATVLNRFERMDIVFDALKNNPFGNIGFAREYAENPGLIGNVAVTGGFPLLLMMGLLFGKYCARIYKALKSSRNKLVYFGCFAYLVSFFWDGQFYELYFLFTVALFSALVKHEMAGGEIMWSSITASTYPNQV